MLEDQFKDLREQHNKILFSSKENDDTVYDEENLQSNDEENVGGLPKSFENTQQSVKLPAKGVEYTGNEPKSSSNSSVPNRNNMSLASGTTPPLVAALNLIPQ